MIQLVGDDLYQWDTGRIVQIESDNPIHEVHFTTRQMDFAYVVKTYVEGENTYCPIPNVILQDYQKIYCYPVKENNAGEETVSTTVLSVNKRNRPDDYVYTESERLAFKELEQRIDETAEQIKTIPYIITGTHLGSTSVTLNDFSWEELKTAFADNRPVFIVTELKKKTPVTNVYTLVHYKEIGVPPYAEFTRSANGYIYTLKVTSDGSTTLTSNNISVDETLSTDGSPADAKTVGDRFVTIDNGTNTNIVSTNEQTLPADKQKQARENISAASKEELEALGNRVENIKEPYIIELTDKDDKITYKDGFVVDLDRVAKAAEGYPVVAIYRDHWYEMTTFGIFQYIDIYTAYIISIDFDTGEMEKYDYTITDWQVALGYFENIDKVIHGITNTGTGFKFRASNISVPSSNATIESYRAEFNELSLGGSPVWATPHRSVKCYRENGSIVLERDHIYMVNGDDVSLVITYAGSGEVWSVKNVKFVMAICGRVGDFYDENNPTKNQNSRDCAYAKILYPKSTLGITSVSSTAQPIYGGTEGAKKNKYTATISWNGIADVTEL